MGQVNKESWEERELREAMEFEEKIRKFAAYILNDNNEKEKKED